MKELFHLKFALEEYISKLVMENEESTKLSYLLPSIIN